MRVYLQMHITDSGMLTLELGILGFKTKREMKEEKRTELTK